MNEQEDDSGDAKEDRNCEQQPAGQETEHGQSVIESHSLGAEQDVMSREL